MAKVLFLHGLDARPGGIKPSYLARCGHDVLNPALPREDFAESIRIAQAEFNQHQPDVVVGSSRGGAVALAIDVGNVPLVLLAPAWKFFPVTSITNPATVRILHSPADSLIPIDDSRELVSLWPNADMEILEVGSDHSMTDADSLAELDRVVRTLTNHSF